MRVAVTAQGPTLDSPVDPRFGRCRYFVVWDDETEQIEVIDNSAGLVAAGGAGVQAAEKVANAGVRAVITGHCGPNAHRALTAAGIKIYLGGDGTVAQAIEQWKQGQLKEGAGPDVSGHW